MESLVLYQFSKIIIFVFFVVLCIFAVKIFMSISRNIVIDVFLCFVIFCFLLAFKINFW